MSEREFEAWLALLGGLLKLNPQQRKDISEELRTHLEERLDDLIASGLSRDDAIAAALEEFGDAAGLAQHFTHIAHLRNRRRLMRWTYGTIAATTCAILTLAAFWPNNQVKGPLAPADVAAQDATTSGAGSSGFASGGFGAESAMAPKGSAADPFAGSRERIEAKLSQPYENSSFPGVPLLDVLDDFSTALDLDILIDGDIKDMIQLDETVDFMVKPGRMSARTVLQTILNETHGDQFSYVIRDEVIFITNKASATEIQTYNVCDLVASNGALAGSVTPSAPRRDSAGDYAEAYGGPAPGAGFGYPGGAGAYPGAGKSSSRKPAEPTSAGSNNGNALVEVIEHTIQPGTWVTAPEDDEPTIEYFNGLLIVKHTQEAHRQIKQLLEQMRASIRERERVATYSPPVRDEDAPYYSPAGSSGGGAGVGIKPVLKPTLKELDVPGTAN